MDDPATESPPPLPLDLLDAGDPAFVAALRGVADAGALAQFAVPWHADARPASRALLSAYLDQPPNAPGHEGLIKRLFKLAEAASDDEVMARFLILTDRLIVRKPGFSGWRRYKHFSNQAEAQQFAARLIEQGWSRVDIRRFPLAPVFGLAQHRVSGIPGDIFVTQRHSTLPRYDRGEAYGLIDQTNEAHSRRRWFSVATRRYLQRRAWRYFRHLGQADPGRYLAAAEAALGLYRDDELADGLALLDHLGLMRLLFGASPALRFQASGCDLAIGHTLAELAPSPAFASVWSNHPAAVLRVLMHARAAVVARWAVRWVEADRARFLDLAPTADWVGLLDRDDPAVVGLALGMLEAAGVDRLRREVDPAGWIAAVEGAAPHHQAAICDWVARVVEPAAVPPADAVRLAVHPAEAVARLGWGWMTAPGRADESAQGRVGCNPTWLSVGLHPTLRQTPSTSQPHHSDRELFPLVDARCPALRPAMLDGVSRAVASTPLAAEWTRVLATSRHADARALGLGRLGAGEGFQADPGLWTELVGSPYPDVQAWCATVVEPPGGAAPARRDRAWAAVLLRPEGMARAKPAAIRRVVARLDGLADDDAEAGDLIALLADVARSPRAPERRAALAALVGLATRRPAWEGRIEKAVPALQIGG